MSGRFGILSIFLIIALIVLTLQFYLYGDMQDKYCSRTSVVVSPEEWDRFLKKNKSKDQYIVLHINEALLNKLINNIFSSNNSDYKACARINVLTNKVELLMYKNPFMWFTMQVKAKEIEPYLEIEDFKYTIFPLGGLIEDVVQKEISTAYTKYFKGRLSTRKLDKIEIQEGEVLIYSAYK